LRTHATASPRAEAFEMSPTKCRGEMPYILVDP
jgi:hypothetical protein